jgi:hypothetical protein
MAKYLKNGNRVKIIIKDEKIYSADGSSFEVGEIGTIHHLDNPLAEEVWVKLDKKENGSCGADIKINVKNIEKIKEKKEGGYYQKYLKYKQKYLQLKNQSGGDAQASDIKECVDNCISIYIGRNGRNPFIFRYGGADSFVEHISGTCHLSLFLQQVNRCEGHITGTGGAWRLHLRFSRAGGVVIVRVEGAVPQDPVTQGAIGDFMFLFGCVMNQLVVMGKIHCP